MRILNEANEEILDYDINYGYIRQETILKKHHAAIERKMPKSHKELIAEFPNGGKSYREIIDDPGVEPKEAWDEYENILRYIKYGPEELERINEIKNKPGIIDKINAQTTYTAMETNTLIDTGATLDLTDKKTLHDQLVQNITKWYRQGLWTGAIINEAVVKGILTQEEANTILNPIV